MSGLTIGEVARLSGVAASALRYYEKAGLIPAPARSSNSRRYDRRIRILLGARAAGFSVRQPRAFLDGLVRDETPAVRWRAVAQKKAAEWHALMARLVLMKSRLETGFDGDCRRFEDCERVIAAELAAHAG